VRNICILKTKSIRCVKSFPLLHTLMQQWIFLLWLLKILFNGFQTNLNGRKCRVEMDQFDISRSIARNFRTKYDGDEFLLVLYRNPWLTSEAIVSPGGRVKLTGVMELTVSFSQYLLNVPPVFLIIEKWKKRKKNTSLKTQSAEALYNNAFVGNRKS